MHTTMQLLDQAKATAGLASDYKLGLVLGLTTSAVSNYRNGRSSPDDATGNRLADLARLDPGYVLACLHAERARDDGLRALWQGVAARLARAGAAASVACITWTGSPDALACSPGQLIDQAARIWIM